MWGRWRRKRQTSPPHRRQRCVVAEGGLWPPEHPRALSFRPDLRSRAAFGPSDTTVAQSPIFDVVNRNTGNFREAGRTIEVNRDNRRAEGHAAPRVALRKQRFARGCSAGQRPRLATTQRCLRRGLGGCARLAPPSLRSIPRAGPPPHFGTRTGCPLPHGEDHLPSTKSGGLRRSRLRRAVWGSVYRGGAWPWARRTPAVAQSPIFDVVNRNSGNLRR